jgi:energy-converting hydrogenase Eha subunit E
LFSDVEALTNPFVQIAALELMATAAAEVVLVFDIELVVMPPAFGDGDADADASAGPVVKVDRTEGDATGIAAIFLAPHINEAVLVASILFFR